MTCSLCKPYVVRVAHTVTRGVRVGNVMVGSTHPICSIPYVSTGDTNFDQSAKIFTEYKTTVLDLVVD